MKAQKPLPRLSAKRRKALGDGPVWSTIQSRPKPLKKRARKKSETLRIYGPPARRAFVASLPCAACGVVGYSENAHIETGGTGRKADADRVIPLCGPRPSVVTHYPVEGCHRELHRMGRVGFETLWAFDLDLEAQRINERWQAYMREQT